MNTEIKALVTGLENTLHGQPWYGRPVLALLQDTDPQTAFVKPSDTAHAAIDLLYHMLTWAEFALKRIEKDPASDVAALELLDWREIDPSIHGWEEGLAAFIATHQQIIALLQTKTDEFLNEKVDYRDYNFRFLLNGLIQHNIYHAGQIAYLNKLSV